MSNFFDSIADLRTIAPFDLFQLEFYRCITQQYYSQKPSLLAVCCRKGTERDGSNRGGKRRDLAWRRKMIGRTISRIEYEGARQHNYCNQDEVWCYPGYSRRGLHPQQRPGPDSPHGKALLSLLSLRAGCSGSSSAATLTARTTPRTAFRRISSWI